MARSTVRGELGIAAKVAPRDPDADAPDKQPYDRLICIHVKDFRYTADDVDVLCRLEYKSGESTPFPK